jgi:hypothetical protein
MCVCGVLSGVCFQVEVLCTLLENGAGRLMYCGAETQLAMKGMTFFYSLYTTSILTLYHGMYRLVGEAVIVEKFNQRCLSAHCGGGRHYVVQAHLRTSRFVSF